jgi:hypothetical protein
MVNMSSEGMAVTSWHDVKLQRLDVLMRNNGQQVLYKPEHFANVSAWDKIPVIFQKTSASIPGEHPDFTNVLTRTLDPAKYITVGYLENVHMSETGEPSLEGKVVFNNENCSLLAQANILSLSTGFSAQLTNRDDGIAEISGAVQPNHVLVFKRGSCPNCYPNDNGAQFLNVQEKGEVMTEEKVEPVVEAAPAPVEVPKVEAPVEVPKVDPIAELRKEYDAKFAAIEQRAADFEAKFINLKWQQVKNTLPVGMVDTQEKEASARKMWEAAPDGFNQIVNMTVASVKAEVKPAEGVKIENTQPAKTEDGFGVITFKPKV